MKGTVTNPITAISKPANEATLVSISDLARPVGFVSFLPAPLPPPSLPFHPLTLSLSLNYAAVTSLPPPPAQPLALLPTARSAPSEVLRPSLPLPPSLPMHPTRCPPDFLMFQELFWEIYCYFWQFWQKSVWPQYCLSMKYVSNFMVTLSLFLPPPSPSPSLYFRHISATMQFSTLRC